MTDNHPWYAIHGVYSGAAEDTAECELPQDAEDAAKRLADEYRKTAAAQGGEEWAVYVTPHYCLAPWDKPLPGDGYSDGGTPYTEDELDECSCVQYLTDHHPLYSSED